ncbi:MAG: hypothetical protein D6720_09110 [Gammaproteobacteria bacterium]|nr:MAG: hypothetical protein D6720_09110 [Gammaproteobacteria bacterium]
MRKQAHPSYERRRGEPAIPENLDEFLTPQQRHGLRQVESFGWRLAFVRHPLFQEPTVVVARPGDNAYASITPDGDLEFDPLLAIRH